MFKLSDSDSTDRGRKPDRQRASRKALVRRMKARRKIERRRDKARLRQDLEDPWSDGARGPDE